MSFAVVATVATVATVVNTVNSINAAKDAERANQQAMGMQREAQAENRRQMGMQEMEFNKRNARAPDAANMIAQAQQAAKTAGGGMGGAGSTMLTGPSGVDPAALSIGRNTLLGM